MLIKEVVGKSPRDIIKESDQYLLQSMLNAIILNIKKKLAVNKNIHYSLDQVINELNNNTDTVYIDPRDEARRNQIMQALEQHGLSVERGSGKISLGQNKLKRTDGEEKEKQDKTREINRKALDAVKDRQEKGNLGL